MTQILAKLDAVATENAALKGAVDGIVAENTALKQNNTAIKQDLGSAITELVAVKAELETVKDTAAAAATAAEEALNNTNTPSNVVYANDFHAGGTLDFTPGSTKLAILEKTLVGVKVFLSSTYIKGTDIQGSVVSRLLKDVTTISGFVECNDVSFADGDSELVFESLVSVSTIYMYSNDDSFTGASFPALTFVPDKVHLHFNTMLKTISMPNLVGVGGQAWFHSNALTSLQLPSLVTFGNDFYINDNPSLATDNVQVSQDFQSVGGTFSARDMKGDFQCTAKNGLSAVVAAASSFDSRNPDTCKKQ